MSRDLLVKCYITTSLKYIQIIINCFIENYQEWDKKVLAKYIVNDVIDFEYLHLCLNAYGHMLMMPSFTKCELQNQVQIIHCETTSLNC